MLEVQDRDDFWLAVAYITNALNVYGETYCTVCVTNSILSFMQWKTWGF